MWKDLLRVWIITIAGFAAVGMSNSNDASASRHASSKQGASK